MNWLDLDNKRLTLDANQVRIACGWPAEKTWAKHRRLCKIPKSQKGKLTVRQACSLWACRWLFGGHLRNSQGELERFGRRIRGRNNLETFGTHELIVQTVCDLLSMPAGKRNLEQFIAWGSAERSGAELLSINPARRPSRATLYRRGLRAANRYNPAAARKLLCPTKRQRSSQRTEAEQTRT